VKSEHCINRWGVRCAHDQYADGHCQLRHLEAVGAQHGFHAGTDLLTGPIDRR